MRLKRLPATVVPLTVACLLASSTQSRSQEVVSGQVVDANTGTPVAAAVVNAVGTPRYTHDFADAVFEIVGWNTYGRGYGLILHGASGRTWLSSDRLAALDFAPQYSDAIHHEVGISFKLSSLIRIDYTRRLDRAEQTVGFSVARYDLEL